MSDAVKRSVTPPPRLERLEDGATRESVGAECREAALAFMTGVASDWTKLDVALWLTGAYARATRHAHHAQTLAHAARPDRDPQADAHAGASGVSEGALDELVTRVRGQVLASLERAALDYGSLDFAEDAVGRGLVRKARDEDGRQVWIPSAAGRMRLRDRVRSLFAADFLNAPYAYTELFVCHRCENVVFDAHSKRLGMCGAHRPSGLIPSETAEVDPEGASKIARAASDV